MTITYTAQTRHDAYYIYRYARMFVLFSCHNNVKVYKTYRLHTHVINVLLQ